MIPEITFTHQWHWLWTRQNWYDFTLIHLEVEDDKMFGNREITVALMGFRIHLLWHYQDTPTGERVARFVDGLEVEKNKSPDHTPCPTCGSPILRNCYCGVCQPTKPVGQ